MIQTVKTSQEKLKKLECEDGTVHERYRQRKIREREKGLKSYTAFQKKKTTFA